MHIQAGIRHRGVEQDANVATDGNRRALAIAAKPAGGGSSVNGGELLMLALATCYCNDLYREARRLGIRIDGVEVQAEAEFDGIGLAARDIRYRARVDSPAPDADIAALLRETDAVAEIHNTVRAGRAIALQPWNGE